MIGKKAGILNATLLLNIVLKFIVSAIKQEKESVNISKEKNLVLFRDYIENIKESAKNLLELMSLSRTQYTRSSFRNELYFYTR